MFFWEGGVFFGGAGEGWEREERGERGLREVGREEELGRFFLGWRGEERFGRGRVVVVVLALF